MAWFWLSASIIAEVLATLALKASGGFTKHGFTFLAIVGYIFALLGLSKVIQVLPVATTYAIWSGAGLALISIASYYVFGQQLHLKEILGITLILSGIIVIRIAH